MESKLVLPSTSIMIEESCNLRCKLCLAYVPYYSNYINMKLIDVKKILKKFFSIVDEVEKFSITGGEPLLNMELEEILLEIAKYEKYISKEIILITNGTMVISPQIIEAFKKIKKLKVIVNNYGEISKCADENYRILEENNINFILYTEDNRYGWIDCRDHSHKHFDEQSVTEQANSCAFFRGKKYVIKRGGLYTCTRSAYRIQEDIIPYSEDDFIDLTDEKTSKEVQREKLRNLLNLPYTSSCAYCDGLTEQSIKYKAAEQLERK